MKNKFLVGFACTLSFFALAGCGKSNIDSSKTQLGVKFYDAGFGSEWLNKLKARFEEQYKNVSFEPGKKGVQIVPHTSSQTDMLADITSTSSQDSVFFTENYYFDYYSGTGTSTPCADITELMSKPLNESIGLDADGNPIPAVSNETVSVLDKFTEADRASYLVDKSDVLTNRVFGIPYIDCYRGTLSYDEDLFDKNGYFFGNDNKLGASLTDQLGLGPDGVADTADDGLPRTYDEFFELCDLMCKDSVVPMTFAGDWPGYLSDLMLALRAQSAGSAQYSELYKGEGTLKDYIDNLSLIEYLESTTATDLSTITGTTKTYGNDTFDRAFHTVSTFGSCEFLYRLIKNEVAGVNTNRYYFGAKNFNGSYTHINAQESFVWGKQYNTEKTSVGMLIDGTWWWNEADKALTKLEERAHVDRMSKNIKYMALPKVNEDNYTRTIGENVVMADYPTAICVKNNLTGANKILAELFTQFACTNESLVEWNLTVTTPRRLSYTFTTEQYNSLTPYGKSIYDVHMSDASKGYGTYKVIYNISNETFYKVNTTQFDVYGVWGGAPSSTTKFFATTLYNNTSNTINGLSFFKEICGVHGNI